MVWLKTTQGVCLNLKTLIITFSSERFLSIYQRFASNYIDEVMIIKTDHLRNSIFGDRDKISSERYFLTLTLFTAFFFMLLLCLEQVITDLSDASILLSAGVAITLIALYFAVRFYEWLLVPKTILTVIGLIAIDFAWYFRFFSNGPMLFFILIFVSLILWLWDGKALLLLLLGYFVNFILLFYIEYNTADAAFVYPNHQIRSIDIFLSFSIFSALLVLLLYVYKREYLRQKRKAINSDRLKSAFLANMSHEIRTPMNGILGFSDLLKNQDLTGEKQQEYIAIIEKSGHRMLNVINDIMDISRIEAGLSQVEIQEININNQLNYIHEFFSLEAGLKGLKLINANAAKTAEITIRTDREKVLAIVTNLVKNAIKYSKKGVVEIGCVAQETVLEIYVKDQGIGIAADRQKVIFERFIQADIDDLQARQGAGLGLSISKAYAELLGGEIRVESEVGVGSKFSFTLPFTAKNK